MDSTGGCRRRRSAPTYQIFAVFNPFLGLPRILVVEKRKIFPLDLTALYIDSKVVV